ncbi:uncharacterized protein C8A04DRAFT_36175 [Dichotomopilus funicola]|uniref:Uncharacterized protein n=1 Tax=Dichotomopilus funicola TaxID=1934379 RepID=A0AAN6V592_9PEZI|nr:hypothetical protein C8A04DRAFT_36175 [Dichotomopilus funicola]
MASIGNVTAAAVAPRAETTLALANLHFEVNLFTKRVNPPAEYEGVGRHLAKSRLEEAQNGTPHSTARKLGLLFKHILPSTPNLIKAYGTRASEISKSAKANTNGDDSSYGPFVSRIGADATTLWAAATSGHAAIQSTSLWDENIANRKIEVAKKLEAEGEIETDLMLAAREQLPRSDLADWDASSQQTKLRLIIDNLDMPVNNKPNTYESMEKLLEGIHRPVQSGAVLLGLMAWHLYPDLQCMMARNPQVELRDPLFEKSGILTIGLEPAPGREARSVYWSLPLAHLRYYGLPVTKFSSMRTSERDRVTVDELLFAWFCAYIKAWDSDPDISTEEVIRYAGDVALNLHNALHTTVADESWSWLLLLSQIANKWATSLDQPRASSLRTLGRNFGGVVEAPFQGIFTVNTYLDVAIEIEDKIRFLREIAKSISAERDARDYQYLIIYHYGGRYQGSFEVATACPEVGIRGDGIDSVHTSRAHRRWVRLRSMVEMNPPLSTEETIQTRIRRIQEFGEEVDQISSQYPFFEVPRKQPSIHQADSRQRRGADRYIHHHGPRSRKPHTTHDETTFIMKASQTRTYEYDVVFGHHQGVALLSRRERGEPLPKFGHGKPNYTLSVKRLMGLFKPGRIDFALLAKMHLRLDFETNASLLGMTFIDSLYRQLGDATVDIRAAKVDLNNARWVKRAFEGSSARTRQHYLAPSGHTIATTFACIAMMETGSFNFDPWELVAVFALCSADSMYIASALLRDPSQVDGGRAGIQRVTGNIGRAGMALMIPPPDPDVRNYGVDDWYLYPHQVFDGVLDDSFGGTSLQLSFTEWKQEVNVGTTGGKDIEAYFLETLISVYDKAKWVADLDVLSAFRREKLVIRLPQLAFPPCSPEHGPPRGTALGNISQLPRLISVGNFAEIIVAPSAPGIVTARGNWQARLAAACISTAKGYRVILTPHGCCWSCWAAQYADARRIDLYNIIQSSGNVMIL